MGSLGKWPGSVSVEAVDSCDHCMGDWLMDDGQGMGSEWFGH